jgi:KDO2-lipid IV(A) lauroyltransferase
VTIRALTADPYETEAGSGSLPAVGRFAASPAGARALPGTRERLEQLVLLLAVRALSLPTQAAAVRFGGTAGAAYGAVARILRSREHRIAVQNLERAFPAMPANQRAELLAAMWRHWGRTLAEIARLDVLGRTALRELVRLDPPDGPREIFDRARDTGSLVLTAHFGSFEMLHAGCAAHGYPITVVHRTLSNHRVDRWLTSVRERAGTTVLRTGSAARQILRALRAGHVVAVPFDQRPPAAAPVMAPFFAQPAPTNSGLARLALASGAPVFPVVIVREGESERHRAVFGPAIELERSADRERDLREATQLFNAVLEDVVRAHPEQWIWMYNRWKPGAAATVGRSRAPVGRDTSTSSTSADRTP